MTQAKKHYIHNSKAGEVTSALYWLLLRRIGTHLLLGCGPPSLALTTALLVNRLCRAFLASGHKLNRIGYIMQGGGRDRSALLAFGAKKWNLVRACLLFHGFDTYNRISCRPIMQSLPCLMTQGS